MAAIGIEKRRQPRKTPPVMMGLTFALRGRRDRYVGVINDISKNGIGISTNAGFTPGTLLELFLEESNTYMVGEVRWCAPDDFLTQTYHIGVMAPPLATM